MTAAAPLSFSTNVACAAPRDSASMPAAPEPANRSRTFAPGRSGSRIAKSVCLTRSASGRVPGPGCLEADAARRPGDDPAGVSRTVTCRSPVRRPPRGAASRPGARPPGPAAAGPSGRRGRAAPRRALAPGPPGRGARRPGARRPGGAGSRLCARPRTSPSLRSSKSFSASSNPSCDSTTARRRASAISSVESDTSTQNDSTLPRPTRPRSWWSWARPNRSAPSMTIIVAAGTSTPTSTTVVPTRTSSSPSRKRVISASRSAGFIRPWTMPTRSGSSSADSRTASLSAATAPSPSSTPSSISGTTTNVRCPSAASSRTLRHVPSRSAGRLTPVRILTRPAGGVRRSDTSRSA